MQTCGDSGCANVSPLDRKYHICAPRHNAAPSVRAHAVILEGLRELVQGKRVDVEPSQRDELPAEPRKQCTERHFAMRLVASRPGKSGRMRIVRSRDVSCGHQNTIAHNVKNT